MNNYYVIGSLEDIESVAAEFIGHFSENRLFAFYGEMGIGKTTFIKALCKVLGVTSETKSPTFSVINVYLTGSGEELYHFDCYRIEKLADFVNIGYEDYFNSGNYCFIEWAENIESALTHDVIRVKMTLNEFDKSRIIQVL